MGAPEDPGTAQDSGSRRAGYRLLGLALFVGLGLLIVLPLVRRSRTEVVVVYHFGDEGRRIAGARMDYFVVPDPEREPPGDDRVSVAWEFGSAGAPIDREHRAHLWPGDHRVGIRLRYRDGTWKTADTNIDVPQGGKGRIVVDVPESLAAQLTPPAHRAPPTADTGR